VNLLLSELRMVVPDGGIIAATPRSIELFAPYALGISCGTVGRATIVSLLPADSAMLAEASFSGYAWRRADGGYAFVDTSIAIAASTAGATCAGARITTLAGGREVAIEPALPAGAPAGTPLFLVQRLRYWFGPSSDIPGGVALLRTRPLDGTTEELASPFDSASHFRFFRTGLDTSEPTPPATTRELRGIELVLTGLSTRQRFGASRPERSLQRTSVFFTNAGPP
jgi:hypothetical protein